MTDFKSNPHVKCSPFNPSEQVLRGGLCTLYEWCILNNLAQTRAFKWKPFSQKEATEEPCYRSWQWLLNVVFRRLYQWETAVLALTLSLVAIHYHSHTMTILQLFSSWSFQKAALLQIKMTRVTDFLFQGLWTGLSMPRCALSASGVLGHRFQR